MKVGEKRPETSGKQQQQPSQHVPRRSSLNTKVVMEVASARSSARSLVVSTSDKEEGVGLGRKLKGMA